MKEFLINNQIKFKQLILLIILNKFKIINIFGKEHIANNLLKLLKMMVRISQFFTMMIMSLLSHVFWMIITKVSLISITTQVFQLMEIIHLLFASVIQRKFKVMLGLLKV